MTTAAKRRHLKSVCTCHRASRGAGETHCVRQRETRPYVVGLDEVRATAFTG
jgi:hypothetical protein